MYPHERSLVKRLEDKPFALIGVNSDRDKQALKQVMKKEEITWRSFWNGGSTRGPISTAWNVRGWPTIYILDHNGVIRAKNARGPAMDKVVDTLLEELESLPADKRPAVKTVSAHPKREWSDSTGQFTIIAKFVKFEGGKPYLEKEDGKIISLPMTKLSKNDQKYVRELLRRRR